MNPTRWACVAMAEFWPAWGASLSVFPVAGLLFPQHDGGPRFHGVGGASYWARRPVPAALACLLFDSAMPFQIRLQGVTLWGNELVPVQFIQILLLTSSPGHCFGGMGGRGETAQIHRRRIQRSH